MSVLQAVFFDFDGVIADTEPLHLRAYQAVLQADGIDLNKSEYYARYLGYDDVGLFDALAKDRHISLSDEKIDEWVAAKSTIVEEMLSSDSILFPGAAACVRMFAERVPLAVASGALATGNRDRPPARRLAQLLYARLPRHRTASAASRRPICISLRWPS